MKVRDPIHMLCSLVSDINIPKRIAVKRLGGRGKSVVFKPIDVQANCS